MGEDPPLPEGGDLLQITRALKRHFRQWERPEEKPAKVEWEVVL